MKKLVALLLTTVMAMTLFTACGSSEAETETAAEVSESADGATSAALADGVLTVGTNAEFPPFEYVGDDGQPDGFDMALVKAIGEKLGVEVKIEHAEGLDECKKMLLLAKAGKKNGCLIEGMGCPGGCVAGAGTNVSIVKATNEVKKVVDTSSKPLPPKDLYEIDLP